MHVHPAGCHQIACCDHGDGRGLCEFVELFKPDRISDVVQHFCRQPAAAAEQAKRPLAQLQQVVP